MSNQMELVQLRPGYVFGYYINYRGERNNTFTTTYDVNSYAADMMVTWFFNKVISSYDIGRVIIPDVIYNQYKDWMNAGIQKLATVLPGTTVFIGNQAALDLIAAQAAAAKAAYELQKQQEQLRLQQEMLASQTATWAADLEAEAAAKLAAETAAAETAAKAAAASEEAARLAAEAEAKAAAPAVLSPVETVAPQPQPVAKCTEGTTRTVKCPRDPNKLVTQRCVNGAWVTLPADEKAACGEDPARAIIAAIIIAIVLVFLGSKAGK